MKKANLLFVAIGSVLMMSSIAKASPISEDVVWETKGKAVYTPASGIMWAHTDVTQADGTTLSIGCQSGPFTPYAVDGRVYLVDQPRRDKQGNYISDANFKGGRHDSRRYANDAESCYKIVQWFANSINKYGNSRITLNESTGDVSVEPR